MTEVSPLTPQKSSAAEHKNGHRLVWLLLLSGILLLLGWLGWKAWRTYEAASSLLARQEQAQQLLSGGAQSLDPQAAEALLAGLRQDVSALQRETGFALPLLPLFRDLPGIGPAAVALPALLEMGDAGTEAAVYGFRGLRPALEQRQAGDAPDLAFLLSALDGTRPDLARTAVALDRVTAARTKITNADQLPGQVQRLIALTDEWLPVAQDGLRAALVLPELAGAHGPRRYLILAQNQDELRPSGGFISGAGLLQIDNGRVTYLDFQDANKIDAWEIKDGFGGALTKPYADAPQAMLDFQFLDLFLFRDANYWPDFRASGQKAIDLYAYGREVPPPDGAIAIDQDFLRLLLSAIGPVQLPDTGETINSGNVLASLREAWTLQDGVAERKAFLGPFAAAIMQKLMAGSGDMDPVALARAMIQALDQKHLQIYVRDPQAATMMAANGWDGRLQPPLDHDALMVVDTNVGYNKANLFIDRDVNYAVQLDANGGGLADLTVTHRHLGPVSGEPCIQGTLEEYIAGSDYDALADKCYWNYLRVYAPEGSTLISGPEHMIPGQSWFGGYDWSEPAASLAELPGFTTFASWMLLPRGADLSSEFQYQLPQTVTRSTAEGAEYALQLYKQAGVQPHRVQASITLPPGTALLDASPAPTAREGNTYTFSLELDRDQLVRLVYK